MTGRERLEAVRRRLLAEKRVTVSALSQDFSVTEETIRRDLEKLEDEGFLKRTYGGAILNMSEPTIGVQYYKRAGQHAEEKRQIAQKALPLIDGISTLAVDSSSTVMELVKLIKDRDRLTILTNSTYVFLEAFGSNAVVMSTGGIFNDATFSLTGETAKSTIEKFHVDTMVFSCTALSKWDGALDSREADAVVKKAMFEQTSRRILLVDHSKFDKAAFVRLIDFDRIDYIVTDREPSDEWKQILLEHGVHLIY